MCTAATKLYDFQKQGGVFMKIAICDNELYYVKNVRERIERYFQDNGTVINEYQSSNRLIDDFHNHEYDIIFLDVKMDDIDGINVAKRIKEIKPNCIIIFISAYPQYIHDSYRVDAFQFLTKPINDDLFRDELDRAIKKYKTMTIPVTFNTSIGTITLKSNLIVYLETSYKNYKLSTISGIPYYGSTKGLTSIKKELINHNFCYINRSTLINLDLVQSIINDTVLMSSGDILLITKTKKDKFKKKFLQGLEKEGNIKK